MSLQMYKILEKYKISNNLMDEVVAYHYQNDYQYGSFLPFTDDNCRTWMKEWERYQSNILKQMPCYELYSDNSENSVYIITKIEYDEPIKVSDISVIHDKVILDENIGLFYK